MTDRSSRSSRGIRTGRRGGTRALATLAFAAGLAGCSAANPGNYETFDRWTANDIEVYQLGAGAEKWPEAAQIGKMLYGPVLTPPLALYDAGLIIASPFVWTYYAAGGGSDQPEYEPDPAQYGAPVDDPAPAR